MTLPILFVAAALAQSPVPSPLAPLKFLEGTWAAASTGQPGRGAGQRTYELVMNGRYLRSRSLALYPPSEKNPNGETHEDQGFFSFDRARKSFVLRRFHVEGFVNQYVCPAAGPDAKVFVFTSEAIENIPAGWKARETIRATGPDEVTETFELAQPGKPFEIYTETKRRRKPQ